MKTKLDEHLLNEMSKDPGNWKGPFYFNRKDPRLSVPKQNPALGWTLNFASPYAFILFISIAAIIIGVSFLSHK